MKTKNAFGALREYQKYLQDKDKTQQEGEDIFLPKGDFKKGVIADYLNVLKQMYSVNEEQLKKAIDSLERYEKHSRFLRDKFIELELGEVDYTQLIDTEHTRDKRVRFIDLIKKYSELKEWLNSCISKYFATARVIRDALRDCHKRLFGERIRRIREENNLSQQALADRLDIPKTTLRQYEIGKTEMSLWTLANFVKAFGITADSLLTFD